MLPLMVSLAKQPTHDLRIAGKERSPATMLVNKALVGEVACGLYVQDQQLLDALRAEPCRLVQHPYVA